MDETLRCFVAVALPGETRERVGAFVSSLASSTSGVKWVKEENLHLTLKFLGSVEGENLAAAEKALEGSMAAHRPFSATLRGAGVFPPRGRPRVVWLDLAAGGDETAALRESVEGALEPLGFPPEGRSFTPHLTIGRVKELRDPGPLVDALSSARNREWGTFSVDRVHLMSSELFPTGPRYSILHTVRLAE